MDSAFFSDAIITSLDAQGVEYTVSVPFERSGELKERIEARRWWHRIEAGCAYFEAQWKGTSTLTGTVIADGSTCLTTTGELSGTVSGNTLTGEIFAEGEKKVDEVPSKGV